MRVKYIPYSVNLVSEQALLRNIGRSHRHLTYLDEEDLSQRLDRGLPYYTLDTTERVGPKQEQKGNLLIRGNALHSCAYLKEQGIEVDLVYIDPPFASGVDYAKKIQLRQRRKTQDNEAQLSSDAGWEQKFYGDIWSKSDYLNWMMENLAAIREVMSANASIYVHLDWHIGHYVKVLMDEVFGEDNFRNEIIWHYPNRLSQKGRSFPKLYDRLLLYTKSEDFTLNELLDENWKPSEAQIKRQERGYEFYKGSLIVYDKNKAVEAGFDLTKENVNFSKTGRKRLSDIWIIDMLSSNSKERTDYPTQKPEALLERIIRASSNEGMVVADFFGGSGTTAQVAARLGRRFISVDVSYNALHTSRDRLKKGKANFTVFDIKDGVRLLRNPAQTMERLPQLIPDLDRNLPSEISKFWYGVFHDDTHGIIPVYVPDLGKHPVLDQPIVRNMLFQEIGALGDRSIKKVVIYYVNEEDLEGMRRYIRAKNKTKILTENIELRDMKILLGDIIMPDQIEFRYFPPKTKKDLHRIEIGQCLSDAIRQKLDEYNQKRRLNADPKRGAHPIELSDSGLEVIEMVALDCQTKQGVWRSDAEIIIAPDGTITKNGEQTNEHWDGSITCAKKPLRLKVRNIAGDETVLPVLP